MQYSTGWADGRYYNTPPNPGTTAGEKINACFSACRDKDDVGNAYTWRESLQISGFVLDSTSGHCGCAVSNTNSFCENTGGQTTYLFYAMKAPKCKPRLPHLDLAPKDLLPTQTNITSNKYCASQKRVRPYSGHTGVSGNPGTTYAEKLDACLKACTGDDKIVDVDSGYHNSDFWDYYNGSDVTHFIMTVWGRCYCYVDPIPDEDERCPRHGGPAGYDGNYKAFKVIPPDLSTGQPARGDSVYDDTGTVPARQTTATRIMRTQIFFTRNHTNCANLIANAWWGVELKTSTQYFTVKVHSRDCCNETVAKTLTFWCRTIFRTTALVLVASLVPQRCVAILWVWETTMLLL